MVFKQNFSSLFKNVLESKILKNRLPQNGDFLLLILLTFLIHSGVFDPNLWPGGDTQSAFQMFYGFYTDFFFHHELARWLPWGSYGIQADYWQLLNLSPASYLAGMAGALLKIENALALFKASVLIELILLLGGTYLLCRTVFRHRTTIFFVSLGAMASTLWWHQIFWNLRFFYLLPFVFYLILVFFQKKQPHYLWLSGITFVLSQLGKPPYFCTLEFLIVLLFFCLMSIKNLAALRAVFTPSKKGLFFLIFLGLFALIFVSFASRMLDHIHTERWKRSSEDHIVSMDDFLTTSGLASTVGPEKYLGFFFPDTRAMRQGSTFYAGILPLILAFYALWKVRKREFWAFAFLAVFLACFALGKATFVAPLTYRLYLPIRFFRYIGIVGGLLRPLLLILAGFGLDHLLDTPRVKGVKASAPDIHKTLLFSGLVIFPIIVFFSFHFPSSAERLFFRERPLPFYFILAGSMLGFLLLLSKKRKPLTLGIIAILFLGFDLLFYQYLHLNAAWHYRFSSIRSDVPKVFDFPFQRERLSSFESVPGNPRAAHAAPFADPFIYNLQKELHTFMLFDSCLPRTDNYSYSQGVYGLFDAAFPEFLSQLDPRGSKPFLMLALLLDLSPSESKNIYSRFDFKNDFFGAAVAFLEDQNNYAKHKTLKKLLKCSDEKLSLATNPVIVENESVAKKIIAQNPGIGQKIVLYGVPAPYAAGTEDPAAFFASQNIRILDFSFNRLDLEIDAVPEDGGWLYYADAYHPGWKAWVDGNEVPVVPANLAFKAIWIGQGKHRVRFAYFDGLQGVAAYFFAISGILFTAFMLGGIFFLLFRGSGFGVTARDR